MEIGYVPNVNVNVCVCVCVYVGVHASGRAGKSDTGQAAFHWL